MIKKEKRGVAPIITTVLLVLIVLILATVIILWGTSFIPEALGKFGEPIENSCTRVAFSADRDGDIISIVNNKDIPIYKIAIKQEGISSSDLEEFEVNLDVGGSDSVEVSVDSQADSLSVIPIILGTTDDGKIQEFKCPESSWQVISL